MSDFQDRVSDFRDRRSPAAHGDQAGAQGPGGGGAGGSVHQVVFRWDGNQGRQGTGMKAVAHSCPAERAEELGRELGPLLWVSGAAAARQSVVRTVSQDGDVMLVQRWPTTDRGGRPSTISHVLIGDPATLKTRQCLGLSYGGWGSRESAEKASGRLRVIECAQLDAVARKRLPAMLELLPAVKHALILVAAEWLRDPAQRVSLLAEEKGQPGWPDQDAVPVAYLGLFLLFGRWLGQEWTFATHDTVDTHQLRLMCVPRWEPDAGGAGPLARVTGRRVTPRFEHKAAARLVDHLLDHHLAHPDAAAGVPQLVDELADGAGLEWARRRVLLNEILSTDRRTGPRTDAQAPHSPEPGPIGDGNGSGHGNGHGDGDGKGDGNEDKERAETTPPPRPPKPDAYPDPYLDPHPDAYSDPHPDSYTDRHPDSYPDPYPDSYADPYPDTYAAPAPEDSPPMAPPRPLRTPGQAPVRTPAHEEYGLHEDLRDHRRANHRQRGLLAARLHTLPDELLLGELRSADLPPESVELLLDELGNDRRVQERRPQMRHDLCAEVLHNGLYFTPYGQGPEPVSRTAMVSRAADLFTWAVAPLAREERYLRDLRELLHRMTRDSHPTGGNWLRQSIIAPPNGQVPDLPPVLWQQILRDVLSRGERAPSVPQSPSVPQQPSVSQSPSAPQPPPASQSPYIVPAPTTAPEPSSTPPRPPTLTSRLSDLTNNPGCVMGVGFAVIAVLLTIVLIAL
ncbi:hypothetical protein [Streptomyces olivochromogenes]|uniref:Uncharacterized protein n=1 Tax=Streptomyces olivochromogenes TaxID=1963 RepID=A0A250VP14_STROL|nr:hypothetical protein [Streptomyces olivochromogenes]GAX55824.1 hypothetical protein SO3561_07387 [Streptomyces olivochromogenes]